MKRLKRGNNNKTTINPKKKKRWKSFSVSINRCIRYWILRIRNFAIDRKIHFARWFWNFSQAFNIAILRFQNFSRVFIFTISEKQRKNPAFLSIDKTVFSNHCLHFHYWTAQTHFSHPIWVIQFALITR